MKPVLQSQLRDIYTEEVDEAWDHVCNFIIAKLVEGLERKETTEDHDQESSKDTNEAAEKKETNGTETAEEQTAVE